MVLKLSKKVHFLQFCADFIKKSESVKAIYIYAFESSHYTLSENYFLYADSLYSLTSNHNTFKSVVSHRIINNTIY